MFKRRRLQFMQQSKKGFVLLDALIGVTILSIAICAMALMYMQTTKTIANSAGRTKATYLAQQTLDLLKAQDGNQTITDPVHDSADGYTVEIKTLSVSAIAADAVIKTYLIPKQVTVTWTESGQQNSVKMIGYNYVTK